MTLAASVQLRNRTDAATSASRSDDADSGLGVLPRRPLSVRVATWALAIAAALIAGVISVLAGGGSERLRDVKPAEDKALAVMSSKRAPPPSMASRFWKELWRGKAMPSRRHNKTKAALLSDAIAACRAHGWQPETLVDLSLEIRWGIGEIQQHRKVHVLQPARTPGGAAEVVAEPHVDAVWNVCAFAATHRNGLPLRCSRNRLLLEVGSGASSLAMASRGMRVISVVTDARVHPLQELQCLNGLRWCRSKSLSSAEQSRIDLKGPQGGINVAPARSDPAAASGWQRCRNHSLWQSFAPGRFTVLPFSSVASPDDASSQAWAPLIHGEQARVELLYLTDLFTPVLNSSSAEWGMGRHGHGRSSSRLVDAAEWQTRLRRLLQRRQVLHVLFWHPSSLQQPASSSSGEDAGALTGLDSGARAWWGTQGTTALIDDLCNMDLFDFFDVTPISGRNLIKVRPC